MAFDRKVAKDVVRSFPEQDIENLNSGADAIEGVGEEFIDIILLKCFEQPEQEAQIWFALGSFDVFLAELPFIRSTKIDIFFYLGETLAI